MAETDKLFPHILPFSNLTPILNQTQGYLYLCQCLELRIRAEVYTASESFHKR